MTRTIRATMIQRRRRRAGAESEGCHLGDARLQPRLQSASAGIDTRGAPVDAGDRWGIPGRAAGVRSGRCPRNRGTERPPIRPRPPTRAGPSPTSARWCRRRRPPPHGHRPGARCARPSIPGTRTRRVRPPPLRRHRPVPLSPSESRRRSGPTTASARSWAIPTSTSVRGPWAAPVGGEGDAGRRRLLQRGEGRGGVAVDVFLLVGKQLDRPVRTLRPQAVEQFVLAVLKGPLEPSGQGGHDRAMSSSRRTASGLRSSGRSVLVGLRRRQAS